MKKVVIVAHKYLPQPDDDLAHYLGKKKECEVKHIMHSFPDAIDRKSSCVLYKNGKKVKTGRSPDYKFLPEPLVYIKEFFYTLVWSIQPGRDGVFIGMDGLNVLFGLAFKRLGLNRKVIFWSVDFVPYGRFESVWKNKIYHSVNKLAVKHADEVWDLSPRMAEGRRKYLGLKKADYKFHRVVPYGLWTSRIKPTPYAKCEKNTLVFMGHLLPKQGVDMLIKKIPEIASAIPEFKLKIIGDGRFKGELQRIAKELDVKERCQFLGKIKKNKDLENEISKAAVAIAPYSTNWEPYTYYADPGKIKTYLACGVPVLLTDLPWNARLIVNKKCGLIISEDGSDLVKKLQFLLRPRVNAVFRKNARRFAQEFNYDGIFANLDF